MLKPYISAYGKDTVIAIIDSGINYLYPDFVNSLYKGISPISELIIVKLREYEDIYKEGIKRL
ncbi:hypothetical protein QJS64_15640 [Paraclostridium bifermentans]|uniref:Peptidase S8/S53 domain-containing protein n=1 Tax=Paraclostridium bifermentans TaxID=1490 RepID=A0ABY8R323_PARBF|nr:hypothetical protein QJS64_15640 [Paraclostridium bifermentans]